MAFNIGAMPMQYATPTLPPEPPVPMPEAQPMQQGNPAAELMQLLISSGDPREAQNEQHIQQVLAQQAQAEQQNALRQQSGATITHGFGNEFNPAAGITPEEAFAHTQRDFAVGDRTGLGPRMELLNALANNAPPPPQAPAGYGGFIQDQPGYYGPAGPVTQPGAARMPQGPQAAPTGDPMQDTMMGRAMSGAPSARDSALNADQNWRVALEQRAVQDAHNPVHDKYMADRGAEQAARQAMVSQNARASREGLSPLQNRMFEAITGQVEHPGAGGGVNPWAAGLAGGPAAFAAANQDAALAGVRGAAAAKDMADAGMTNRMANNPAMLALGAFRGLGPNSTPEERASILQLALDAANTGAAGIGGGNFDPTRAMDAANPLKRAIATGDLTTLSPALDDFASKANASLFDYGTGFLHSDQEKHDALLQKAVAQFGPAIAPLFERWYTVRHADHAAAGTPTAGQAPRSIMDRLGPMAVGHLPH